MDGNRYYFNNDFNRELKVMVLGYDFLVKARMMKQRGKMDCNRVCVEIICPQNLEIITMDMIVRIKWEIRRRLDNVIDCDLRLINIELNEGLEEIGTGAFSYTNITKLILPTSLRIMNDDACRHCSSLREVSLNDGLLVLGSNVFEDTALKKLVLPKTLEYIGNDVCLGLELKQGVIVYSKSSILKNGVEELENRIAGFTLGSLTQFLRGDLDIIKVKNAKEYNKEVVNNKKELINERVSNDLGRDLLDMIKEDEFTDMAYVFFMLEKGANVDVRDSSGNTGVMHMARRDNNLGVLMYMAYGADLTIANNRGETFATIVRDTDNRKMVAILNEINARQKNGKKKKRKSIGK